MANYTITDEDIKLIQQGSFDVPIIDAQILNKDLKVIGNINGEIITMSLNVDAESDIRRTCSLSIYPTDAYDLNEDSKIWIDKIMRINLGFLYKATNTYKYYCVGTLVITDGSYSYDATNNILNLNLSDLMYTLDGEHGGVLTADETEIGYGWVMSTVMKSVVNQLGGIKNYSIDEMGMYYGIDYYIQKFQEDYVVDDVLLSIVKNAAMDARAYESTTITESTDIRKNTINEVLEIAYNEYINSNNTGINFTFTAFDKFRYGYDYSVVDGELVLTPNGDIPPTTRYQSYYLYNCPELLSREGDEDLYLYDKYGNLRQVICKRINELTCVYMGAYNLGWWEEPTDNTLIRLPDSDLSSKTSTLYKTSSFISQTTYQKLVSAFKYLIEVPYTISVTSGNVLGLITELRDLYPAWETFFESNGTFMCQMIPTCKDDKIVLDENVMDSLVISENRSFTYDAKNLIYVLGKTYNISNYATVCTLSSQIYTATLANYTMYTDGTYICVSIPSANVLGYKLRINDLVAYDIYDTATNELIPTGTLKAGKYVFKYSSLGKFYLLGQYRPSAVIKLVSEEPDQSYKNADKTKYNTTNIQYQVNPDSPYTIEKIGEKPAKLSGDDYDNVYSDSLAMSTAEYNLWKDARLTDTITITTPPIPFLDVNQKIAYRLQKTGEVYEYIVKSISMSISGTDIAMTITAIRYYDLYPDIVTEGN